MLFLEIDFPSTSASLTEDLKSDLPIFSTCFSTLILGEILMLVTIINDFNDKLWWVALSFHLKQKKKNFYRHSF